MRILKKMAFALASVGATLVLSGAVYAAPTGLKQVKDSSTGIMVDWDDSTNVAVDGYFVILNDSPRVEDMADESHIKIAGTTTVSDCTITSLASGKSYYMYLYEMIGDNLGECYSKEPFEVVTKPSDPSFAGNTAIKQTAAKKSSVSFSWPAVAGATGYEVYAATNNQDGNAKLVNTVAGTSATIKTKTPTYVSVVYFRKSASGYVAKCENGADAYKYNILPTPKKAKQPKMAGYNSRASKASISMGAASDCHGYQIEYSKYNGKGKKKFYVTTVNAEISNLNSKVFYRVRVRKFVNLANGKAFGKWSKYTYFCQDQTYLNGKTSNLSSGGVLKFKVSWKKVKGANNYSFYISTNQNSGYKKISTSKSTSIVISSYKGQSLKKHVNYYVRIVANKKVGKKKFKSPTNDYRCIWFY